MKKATRNNPYEKLISNEFKRELAEKIGPSFAKNAKQVDTMMREIRQAFLAHPENHFLMDAKEAPSKDKILNLMSLAENLRDSLVYLPAQAVKELRELGFDTVLIQKKGESDAAHEVRANGYIDLNFPNSVEILSQLLGACTRWVEIYSGRTNRSRPTRKAAILLYERLCWIFMESKPFDDEEDIETEYLNEMLEFVDSILNAANFPHPSIGRSVRGKLYDGAFAKIALTHFRKMKKGLKIK